MLFPYCVGLPLPSCFLTQKAPAPNHSTTTNTGTGTSPTSVNLFPYLVLTFCLSFASPHKQHFHTLVAKG